METFMRLCLLVKKKKILFFNLPSKKMFGVSSLAKVFFGSRQGRFVSGGCACLSLQVPRLSESRYSFSVWAGASPPSLGGDLPGGDLLRWEPRGATSGGGTVSPQRPGTPSNPRGDFPPDLGICLHFVGQSDLGNPVYSQSF